MKLTTTIRCVCPPLKGGGPRHPDGDKVTFKQRLDFREALTVRNMVGVEQVSEGDLRVAELLAILTEGYLLYGIASWSVRDAINKPVPVTKSAITEYLLTSPDANTVADFADELYAEQVTLPLLNRALTSSLPTPTDESTSATTESSPIPLKRSRPSSTSTTQTAVTATTSSSLDGDSSSSQSSTSAA